MNLVFKPLEKNSERSARKLIESGLEGRWGSYDPSFNPDVNDLLSTYGCNCLTAWDNNQLIGVGCWYFKTKETAVICRMSVHVSYRRKNIGSRILAALEKEIKLQSVKNIELETTSEWKEVIQFYLSNGYQKSHEWKGDTYFSKDLTAQDVS